MAGIETTVEAGDVGLDESRLERITSHFDRYVADGRLAGYLATVARGGEVAYVGMGGYRDREADKPMTADTIFRIYSMTKPITTVAAMRLWEEGRFELTDEIAPIIGAFKDPRVFVGGSLNDPITAPSQEPIRIWHLMTHTAGMTYGFQYTHTVDGLYRKAGYEWGSPAGVDLAGACETWASLPLLFEPGTSWNYSIATDVLGRVIECVTGERLDVALRRLVLDPLGMDETGFSPRRTSTIVLPSSTSPMGRTGCGPSLFLTWARQPCGTHSPTLEAVASSRRLMITSVSPACCWRAASSMAYGSCRRELSTT